MSGHSHPIAGGAPRAARPLALILLLAASLPGCGREDARVVSAFDRGVEAFARLESRCMLGTLWILQQLPRPGRNPALEGHLAAMRRKCEGAPGAALVAPGAARDALPETPGRGVLRFRTFVLAPMGLPLERATAFVTRFVSGSETGYVLTHQLLVLEWAEQLEVPKPGVPSFRKEQLLERILAEHRAAPAFSDLFAERSALLLMYHQGGADEVRAWVDTILAAQTEDGHWEDAEGSIVSYDGASSPADHPPAHVTGLALAALGFYLERG